MMKMFRLLLIGAFLSALSGCGHVEAQTFLRVPTTSLCSADGRASYPSGTAQYATLLNGETLRDPCYVPGVDAPVGPRTNTFLPVNGGGLPACISVVGQTVRPSGANCLVQGLDFSVNGGYIFYCVDPTATNLTLVDNKFKVGANAQSPIYISGTCGDGGTISYNELDGNSVNDSFGVAMLIAAGGTWNIQYNWAHEQWQDCYDSAATGKTLTIYAKYNVCFNNGKGTASGAHPDMFQLNSGTVAPDLEFNLQGNDDPAIGSQTMYLGDNSIPTILINPVVTHLTIVSHQTPTGGGGWANHFIGNLTQVQGTWTFDHNYVDFNSFNNSCCNTNAWNINANARSTGTMSTNGTTMIVSGTPTGPIFANGQYLSCSTCLANTTVTASSGDGIHYTISPSQTNASQAFSIYDGPYFASPGTLVKTNNFNMANGGVLPITP